MTTFSVWAPNKQRVDAVVDGCAHAMTQTARGWWSVDVDAKPGSDYGFSLDGEPPVADPRSAWQPAGVDGLSRLVDHDAFVWEHDSWPAAPVLGSLVYEMHVGTFTAEGTFDAAISRLDHLVDLGADTVDVMPVAAFPGRHGWGYDGVFPYAVQDSYGGPTGFKRFVDACHGNGLRVILDVVYNHLGPYGNVLPKYGPYFTDRYTTPWGQAINYCEADSDEVRRYVIDNALMWLRDYRLDGLRLDAVHAIVDTSAVHLLEEMAVEVHALSNDLGRPLMLVAESDRNDPRLIAPREIGGCGVDAQWSDDFHHAVHAATSGETFGYYEDFGAVSDIATAIERGYVYAGRYSVHRRRRHGRPLPDSVFAHQLFGYAQDHDQIGNRARGERLSQLVSPDLAKVAAALVLTSPFTPMLFMGEEWGASTPWQYFTDHGDRDLAESVRHGRRAEFAAFGWKPEEVPDPQDPQTMRRSTLDWSERDREPHRDILRWYRDLIALRRRTPELREGQFANVTAVADEAARTLVVTRGSTLVVANLSAETRLVTCYATEVLLASAPSQLGHDQITMAGKSVAILRAANARS